MTSLANARVAAEAASAIRVMVVDDSAVVRGLVSRWLSEEEGVEVVAKHVNGERAVQDIVASQPDIVILDVEMPVMDGLAALPLLLKAKPGLKVIMASTLTQRNAEISLKALSLGATDYIPKPETNSGVTTSVGFRRDLVQKVKSLAPRPGFRARPAAPSASAAAPASARMAPRSTAGATATPAPAPVSGTIKTRPFSRTKPRILLVGSSTGGPQALSRVFEQIGGAISQVPVLVTQHMPAAFTAILARNLGQVAGCSSKEGEHGEALRPGVIYVAPGGKHMRLAPGATPTITLDEGPEINFCRPAVDPLFETAAAIYRNAALAVVLTGMGHDGAEGAKKVSQAGGSVIAQDEATSVVWGMPGAVAETGCASAILPLPQIGPKLNTLLK